jgi:ketosteroid isomerase-like protein
MNDEANDSTATERAFYAAFAACDVEAMRLVWADSEETLCVHPGGPLLRGKDAVMQSWAEILGGASAPEVSHREIQRVAAGDLVIHTVEESIRPGDSDDPPTRIIATNVYRRTPAGWRMLAHHASLPVMRRSRREAGSLH